MTLGVVGAVGKVGKVGAKFVGELAGDLVLTKLIGVVDDALTMKAVKGKTPEQIAKELHQEVDKAREEEIKTIRRSAKDLVQRDGQEMADRVERLAVQYAESWNRILNQRIDDAEMALVSLKDAYRNANKFEKKFAEIIADLKENMKASISALSNHVESIYKYEVVMRSVEENSHEITVDGEKYMMPDDMIYASEDFQKITNIIHAMKQVEGDDAVVDSASMKKFVLAMLDVYEQQERKLRKHESKEQTEKRFAKIVKEARAAAEKLKEE